MKTIVRLFLFLFVQLIFSTILFGQSSLVYQGKIVDAQTKEPIPFVHLFFNNTSYGTQANEEENFEFQK